MLRQYNGCNLIITVKWYGDIYAYIKAPWHITQHHALGEQQNNTHVPSLIITSVHFEKITTANHYYKDLQKNGNQQLIMTNVWALFSWIYQKHLIVYHMDLSKAFDCLPHSLLIAKLYAYDISGRACRLLSDYLSDRKQRVKLSNSRSTWTGSWKVFPRDRY